MEVNPDLFAFPGLDPTPQGLAFNFNRALPVTVYICPNCGRFKFLSAIFLGNVEAAQQEAALRNGNQPQPADQPNIENSVSS